MLFGKKEEPFQSRRAALNFEKQFLDTIIHACLDITSALELSIEEVEKNYDKMVEGMKVLRSELDKMKGEE